MITTNTMPEEQVMREIALEARDRRGPAWRWKLAEENLHDRPGQRLRRFGRDFLDTHHYRSLCDYSPVGRKQAFHLYPLLAAAEELNADMVRIGDCKVAVLGELDPKEVCRQLNVDEAVFRVWEKTFFDIRGCRSATGWIQIHVIRPEIAAGRGEVAARLRMVAALGPLAAKLILAADTRPPIQEAQKLFERQLKLHLKFDAAVEMTTDTDKSRRFFIGQNMRLLFEERRLKFAREKLEKKCAEALNRRELAKIHAELALERARNRAAARARRDEGVALVQAGKSYGDEWLAVRRREEQMAEQAAMASRVAASPLGRLRWRHRDEPGDELAAAPGAQPHVDKPMAIASVSVPCIVVVPGTIGMASAGVPV